MEPQPAAGQKASGYRTLNNYHWEEITQLKEQQLGVTKIVRINGETDSVKVKDSAALASLFRPLMDADISKPSLADAYNRDTIADQFRMDTTFIFRSKGKQTHPYQLILDVDRQGRIRSAQATTFTTNLMYEFRQEVVYERNKQLRVHTFQKIIFMKPESLEVLTLFHPLTDKI